jgi:tetratricopeptide (TPR) repeat protein
MSLLLEALKKAELAKQIAKADAPLPETPPPEPATAVITREKLPDISQSLEILTDDLPSEQHAAAGHAERPDLSFQESEAVTPATPRTPGARESERSYERAQAQQLFQVKEMDYNPRRPFYLSLAALALVGMGYGSYVWWQLRPKQPNYALVEAQPRPIATPAPPVVPPAPGPASPPPVAQPAPPTQAPLEPAPARSAVPAIPPIQPVRPTRPRTPPAAATSRPSLARLGSPAELSASAAPRAGETLAPIAINAPTLTVDPILEQAYQALQRNDLATARAGYEKALAREPTNRDALLGLAAIDVRSSELDSAELRYLKLLEIDPRDTQAVANLIALRGPLDPVASESRLKTLIANQPEGAHLHFSLGNQYAQQSRWSEAQSAYFKAYSVDPENADYAFNLAVSLDHLSQRKLALQFYQRALSLVEKRVATFPPAQARARVQELSREPGR